MGQGRLMMTFQKLFSEYNQNSGQVLMTKNTIVNPVSKRKVMKTNKKQLNQNEYTIVKKKATIKTNKIQIEKKVEDPEKEEI